MIIYEIKFDVPQKIHTMFRHGHGPFLSYLYISFENENKITKNLMTMNLQYSFKIIQKV